MKAVKKLSVILHRRGLSQSKAAKAIGITQPYLSQILSGHRRPHFDTMQKIRDWSEGLVDYEDWEERRGLAGDSEVT